MTHTLTSLGLKNLWASYGATVVLHDLSLDVSEGEMLALLGPSGCGKTTVLKVIAGLLEPDKGEILFGDQIFSRVPAERREAAMVFQKPLLFPHLTVAENIAFGLRMRKVAKEETARRVAEALEMVQLKGYGERRPKELSGGQEQRISLARALVIKPRVLLLDEPFSALDVGLRAEMRSLVRNLQSRLQITTIFVTHDQEEAVAIADRIAFLLAGRLEQIGQPRDFFTSPRTAEVARFFGWKVIEGERRGRRFETALGLFEVPQSLAYDEAGGSACIAFHPASTRLAAPGSVTEDGIIFPGTIEGIVELGARVRYAVALPSGHVIEIEKDLTTDSNSFTPVELGTAIYLRISKEAIRFFGS
ncbi:MAG: ABC transporter ATP-binding protein [Acidobacteria bacterium]|nr:ABC transporter ATP-binding protein [Acidobacteriota bacterium]